MDGGSPFLVLSLHATPGTDRDLGRHKSWFHAGVSRWLAAQTSPWLAGIDANTPRIDHADAALVEFHVPRTMEGPGEDELLGMSAPHRGRDLFRVFLRDNPGRLEHLRRHSPTGPLAVSHRLGSVGVRYDHVLATEEFSPLNVEYVPAFDASDHAAVVADISTTA